MDTHEERFRIQPDADTVSDHDYIVEQGRLIRYHGKATHIILPDYIETIGAFAFANHRYLRSIYISDHVIGIQGNAFYGCNQLETVVIGHGIQVIPHGCFCSLASLRTVYLGERVLEIEEEAFRNCILSENIYTRVRRPLDALTNEQSQEYIRYLTMGMDAGQVYYVNIRGLTRVRRIADNAFEGCETLMPFMHHGTRFDVLSMGVPEEQPEQSVGMESEQALSVYSEPDTCTSEKVQGEVDFAAHVLTTIHQDAACQDLPEEQSAHLSVLLSGYQLLPGRIVHMTTGREVRDLRVLDMALTKRTRRALHRFFSDLEEPPCSFNDLLLSGLLRFSRARLQSSRWMSYASVNELIRETENFLASMYNAPKIVNLDDQIIHDKDDEDGGQEEQDLFPEYLSNRGAIVHKKSGKIIEDIQITSLPFSVRSKNCLMEGRVKTLSALVVTTREELLSLRNLGMVSFRDILNTANAYLELARKPEQTVETFGEGETANYPEIKSDELVIAPDYVVVHGIIVQRSSLKQIQDAPVEVLGLSSRPANCLINHGIVRLNMLVGLPLNELRAFRNLGAVSEWEITMRLEEYLAAAEDKYQNTLVVQPEESHWQVNNAPFQRNISPSDIRSAFEPDWFAAMTEEEIFARLGEGADERSFKDNLKNLMDNGKVIEQDGVYRLVHPSFIDYLNSMYLMPSGTGELKNQQITVLKKRATGKTLEEIGQEFGVTRERIRQIEHRAMRWIRKKAQPVLEDQYRYLFETYRTSKDFYERHINNPIAWYYLKSRYQAGVLPAQKALDDKGLSKELRRAIEGWAYQGFIRIKGRYVGKRRIDLEDMVVETYCQDEKTFDEFVQMYTDFLREIGLGDEEHLQIDDAVKRTRQNRLADSQTILWKQSQKLRYYNIDNGDYTELLAALNLEQYQNIELSTRLLMDMHPDIMELYDIRDEYELHNLLKKMRISEQFPGIAFNRMPMIQFGTFDRDEAVREILFALAPVSVDDLAEMISLEYGARPDTIKANWLTSIEEYYHQGEYAVDYLELPPEHAVLLNEALTDDFYYFTEVRNIYKQLVPQPDLSLISSFNMKRLGFRVNGTYAFRNYQSAESYFRHLLTQDDFVDAQKLNSRFSRLPTYFGTLMSLRGNYEIIEYEPLKYVKYEWLNAQGLTREDFAAYCDQVYEATLNQGFFTVSSLKKSGFLSKLDNLGLDNWFHSSLLRFDKRFSNLRMAGNIILRTGQYAFGAGDFYSEVLDQHGSIALGQLLDLLWDHYGLKVERSKLLEKIKGTSIYFDRIEEVLYVRYSGDSGSERPGG